MAKKPISPAVIRRLPRYYRYLEDLMEKGIVRINSGSLAEIMQVTSSQIRQDLNQFGTFGQQGYGYNIAKLHDEIGKILNIDHENKLIIIGAGNLGKALVRYGDFLNRGFRVCAIFDKDPELSQTPAEGFPIYPMEDMERIVKENNVSIAAICIPEDEAEETAARLIEIGITGIWNFTNLDLEVPNDIAVENVHLAEPLMCLSYRLNEYYDDNGTRRAGVPHRKWRY